MAGRPTKYKPEYCELATNYCLLGATEDELAQFFDVCIDTITEWKNVHPEFLEALNRGRAEADAKVARSLYQRAIGYSHPAEKIFCSEGQVVRAEYVEQYPPDTAACLIWLKNRRRKDWTNKDSTPGGSETDELSAEDKKVIVDHLRSKRSE